MVRDLLCIHVYLWFVEEFDVMVNGFSLRRGSDAGGGEV